MYLSIAVFREIANELTKHGKIIEHSDEFSTPGTPLKIFEKLNNTQKTLLSLIIRIKLDGKFTESRFKLST